MRSLDIAVPLRFQHGAMPMLEYINFAIPVAEFKDANISLDFGLENLSSLHTVKANISCETASPKEVEEVEAAIRHAVHVHPNHPGLDIRRVKEDKMGPMDAGPRKLNRNNYKVCTCIHIVYIYIFAEPHPVIYVVLTSVLIMVSFGLTKKSRSSMRKLRFSAKIIGH